MHKNGKNQKKIGKFFEFSTFFAGNRFFAKSFSYKSGLRIAEIRLFLVLNVNRWSESDPAQCVMVDLAHADSFTSACVLYVRHARMS